MKRIQVDSNGYWPRRMSSRTRKVVSSESYNEKDLESKASSENRDSGISSGTSTSADDNDGNFDDLFTPKITTSSTKRSKSRSSRGKSKGTKRKRSETPSEAGSIGDWTPGVYEVEDILDYVKDVKGKELYFIKWVGWEEKDNTWESPDSLVECPQARLRFYLKRKAEIVAAEKELLAAFPPEEAKKKRKHIPHLPPDPRSLDVRVLEYLEVTGPLEEEEIMKRFNKWSTDNRKGRIRRNKLGEKRFSNYLTLAVDGKLDEKHLIDLRNEVYLFEIERRKDELNEQLEELAETYNFVTKGKPEISIENKVDLEEMPENFTYIADYVPGPGVAIPIDPIIGCNCGDSCYDNRKADCCNQMNNAEFPYNRFKRADIGKGRPIYECNSRCNCGPECTNRVVQDGKNSETSLCIFRTKNGCGWGVKTLKKIKRGQFVCLYLGEIIRIEDAEDRPKTYIMELDFADYDNPKYAVDANKKGNVSHFINHSCDPNLGVYPVWVDCMDPDLPKIALFALRDIDKGEELSFDYMGNNDQDPPENGSTKDEVKDPLELVKIKTEVIEDEDEVKDPLELELVKVKIEEKEKKKQNAKEENKMKCLCGASNCRKFIYVY